MGTPALIIGLCLSAWALCELYTTGADRASRTRTHALLERASHPQPVPRDGHVYDPASEHDAVLLSLSPAIRRDFQSQPPITPIVDGPAGPSYSRTELQGSVPRSSTSKDGLEGPSLEQ